MFAALIAVCAVLLVNSVFLLIVSLCAIKSARARLKRLEEFEAKIAATRQEIEDGTRPKDRRFKL